MEKVVSADGTPIAFQKSGAGPSLVLVHGTTADHTRWNPILPELEKHFTVYAIDRRGRGESGDTEPYAIDREVEDVAAVVEAAGPGAKLLGHSFGALCSMEAALLTNNLEKLVLYEPPFPVEGLEMYRPGTRDQLQALLDGGDRESLLTSFFQNVVRMPEQEIAVLRAAPAWQARLSAAHTLVREMDDAEYVFNEDRFRALGTPTLLLLGGNSPPFLKAPSELLASTLADSRSVVMPGQGHAAMNTAPGLFCHEAISFLTE